MSEFQIVEWTDTMIPEMLDLSRATLGSGGAVAKTGEFWRWKHCDNPFGRSYGLCALNEDADRLAAMRVLLRWAFEDGDGNQMAAARAVDTATHPDYQRQGLFSRLTQRAVADLRGMGVGTIFNTPNERSFPGYIKMGWSLVDKRPLYLKPLRPLRMVKRRLGPVDDEVVKRPGAFFATDVIVPWDEFVETTGEELWRIALAWESVRTSKGWRSSRTKAYYTWRYGQNPNVTYYVYGMHRKKDGELDGFAVLRPNVRYGWQEAVLCEMVLAEPLVDLGRQLLQELKRYVRADYLIAHFSPDTVEYESLRRSGFVRAGRQGIRFTVRPLDVAFEAVCEPDKWDLSLGDLELF